MVWKRDGDIAGVVWKGGGDIARVVWKEMARQWVCGTEGRWREMECVRGGNRVRRVVVKYGVWEGQEVSGMGMGLESSASERTGNAMRERERE